MQAGLQAISICLFRYMICKCIRYMYLEYIYIYIYIFKGLSVFFLFGFCFQTFFSLSGLKSFFNYVPYPSVQFVSQELFLEPGAVAHAFNPSTLGGRGRQIT